MINCSKLDTIFINPLAQALVKFDKDLKKAYGNFQHIFRGGDFNFLT